MLYIFTVESTGAIPPPLVLSSKISYIYRYTFILQSYNLYHWIPCFIVSNYMTTAAASVIGVVFLKQVSLCNDSNGAIPATLGLFPPHQSKRCQRLLLVFALFKNDVQCMCCLYYSLVMVTVYTFHRQMFQMLITIIFDLQCKYSVLLRKRLILLLFCAAILWMLHDILDTNV